MAKKRPPFDYVNLRGEPVRILPDEAPAPRPAPPARAPRALTAADVDTVFDVVCLAGQARSARFTLHFLAASGQGRADGEDFTTADVQAALQQLAHDGRSGATHEATRRQRRLVLLAGPLRSRWWKAWAWAQNGGHGDPGAEPYSMVWLQDEQDRCAFARLVLGSGIAAADYNRIAPRVLVSASSPPTLLRVLGEPVDEGFLRLVDPALLWGLLVSIDQVVSLRSAAPALADWIDRQVRDQATAVPTALRLRVAEARLFRGDLAGMRQALAGDAGCAPFVPMFEANLLAWQGDWVGAAESGTAALKGLAKALSRRRNLLPQPMLELHLLALLATQKPAHWMVARKLALAESGSRTPAAQGWGLWAHALAVRLGESAAQPAAFELPTRGLFEPMALVLAAWLRHPVKRWTAAVVARGQAELQAAGQSWKAALFGQAAELCGIKLSAPAKAADWPVEFFGSPAEAWRDALSTIRALAPRTADGPAAGATLQWRLTLGPRGQVLDVQAFERSMGARGPGKPKPMTLNRLVKHAALDPRDAAVARCIKVDRWNSRLVRLDRDSAAAALIGHPDLALAETPEQRLELRESLPMLEVRREARPGGGEHFRFHVEPALLDDETEEDDGDLDLDDFDDGLLQPRRADGVVRVVPESAERARLIRLTPTQRQVAGLAQRDWAVPLEAQAELDAAVRVLAGHFLLHSDAEGGELVAAEPRLRAQLTPRGMALELRLLVRPFGSFGPQLAPGAGRARLHTLHEGQSLATERALEAERSHLQAVVEALPFLDDAGPDASWLLEDPEHGLMAVERLPHLPAVLALEWPKGKPLAVLHPPDTAMQLRVKSERDWFGVDGTLQLDEQRVLGLRQLLSLLDGARGQRYVALGEGQYLALTESLRRRLDELAALGTEAGADGLRLPGASAAWLAEAADELHAAGDGAWRQRARRLQDAAVLEPPLPPGLQAELRPYQADGWRWMMRLAHAGFGALLADDMGLGKTVQTLALLLARAAEGPALVVAPTSVCGNWGAEALKFAPGLNLLDYGSADRADVLAKAGAGDVVVASYALLLRDAEAFAGPVWGTLVLDEAQALKNAATKRVQAVAGVQAGFRLALTGTPVENRLADLWSLMNLLNPGLLGAAGRFAERFANPIERQRDDAARGRLRRIVAPFMLRRTKAQVLTELPPRTEIVLQVQPGDDERSLLEALRRQAAERAAALDGPRAAFEVLAELTRLRRAACDPRLVAPELGIVGCKVQEFERLAGELVAGGHQALVFSQFTDFLKLLAERLDSAGIGYQYLDGSTPAAARSERVAAFQRGASPLFLISLKAGGFGLNLTAADYVIIADPWWNPAAEDQASGRAHRMGQQRPVTVYRLVTAGSIEERIVLLHGDKRALAEGLLSGQDGGVPLAADELVALLRG